MVALKDNILKGVFWTGIDVLVNRGLYVLLQLVLAALLFPEAYGIVSMAAVFIALLEIINDLGLGSALIQKKKEQLTSLHYDTAFWTGLFWALMLYALIYFVATPLISEFYEEQILDKVVPFMALTILVSPLVSIHKAKLIKELQFKKIALVNAISNITAGIVSLVLAYKGFGVWALVCYSVVKLVVTVPSLFFVTKWVPSIRWDFKAFRLLFGFGVFTVGTAIANVFSQKIDYLFIGKLIGATALGYYTFAFLVTNVLRKQIGSVLSKVLFPIYAQLQGEPHRLFSLYLKILSVNALLIYPVIIGVLLFAEDLTPLFFDTKWNDAIPIIKVLSVSVLLQIMVHGNQLLFRSYGKVKLEFLLQLVKSFLFFVPLIYIGIHYYGLVGAAYGFTLATLLSAGLTLYFLRQTFGLKRTDLWEAFKIPVAMLLVCSISTWFVLQYIGWQVALGFYIATVLLFYGIFAKKQTRFLVLIIKNSINKKRNT